jgi:hypothetical protein
MPTPSLILVPARFKTGKLYTPVATTSGGLVLGASGDFNVTRATTATRVNASGLIESVASGVPRLDYYTSGGTAGCPALLVEPAATNFAPNVNLMNQFDTPTVSGGVALTTGSTDFLAPDGASGSINKYVGGTATNQSTRYAGAGVGVSASGTYRFSLFVKAGATNPLNFCAIQFALFTGASGTATSYFNLASGTALTSGSSIENYGNGWYRCVSAPYTIAAGDLSGTVSFTLAEGNNDVTWPASGALNLTAYTWGAQMEAGSVATSYIPTTTAAVTRNADVINLSGAVSGCIGQTEGTIYAEVDVRNLGVETYFIRVDDGASTNIVSLRKLNTNNVRSAITAPTTSGTINISSATFTAGILKIAFAYKSGEIALCVNGANLTANGTFTFGAAVQTSINSANFPVNALDRLLLGETIGGVPYFNDRIRAVALYTTRLTNAELQSLTTL